jgi:hypothetical protein
MFDESLHEAGRAGRIHTDEFSSAPGLHFDLDVEMEKLAQLVAARADQIRAGGTAPVSSTRVYVSNNVIQFPPERIVRTSAALSKRRLKRPE